MTSGTAPSRPVQERVLALDPNRVLRNTYWLLALSMLPTVAGALLGMSLNFIALFKAAPIADAAADVRRDARLVVRRHRVAQQRVGRRGAPWLHVHRRDADRSSPSRPVQNGGQLVALAGGMTAMIFFAMATIATVTKDFSFLGNSCSSA
jgi:hypothetical protein